MYAPPGTACSSGHGPAIAADGAVGEAARRPPWGFWGTAGWGVAALFAFTLTQAALVPFFVDRPAAGADWLNGHFIAVGTVVAGFGCTALLVALVAARRGPTLTDYLALRRPRWGSLLLWILAVALFWGALGGLAIALDRPTPTFVSDIFATAPNPALLVFALVVAGPMFEEMLVRGFLFRGWAESRLRVTGTVVLSAALWALLHVQYDAFEIAGLFAYGLLLGFARHRTKTVLVPMALHAMTNAAVCAAHLATAA